MATLLLSDLHLPAAASPLRERFIAFLQGPAREASAVYLLGDVFESWAGDDIGLVQFQAEIAALHQLNATGVPVYLQPGNRDFLLGTAFCGRSGVKLLDDEVVTDIEGVRTLLSHGDLFCTEDRAYQRWRRFSRLKLVQLLFLALPASLRGRTAEGLRQESRTAKQHKLAAIMNVSDEAILTAFLKYKVTRIIHGHTHRPAVHEYLVENRARQRIVLADWRADRCEFLEIEHGNLNWKRLD